MAKNWKGKKIITEESNYKPLIPQTDHKNLKYFSFSFKYFNQIRYFGVGNKDATWFANLYDRLKDLSNKTNAMLEDSKLRFDYRMHPINWNAKNCPITIDDLGLPRIITDNMEDDFIWQFQLSKGTGRVVGFFNEDHTIFYVVLLDPEHNIQPAGDYNYTVNDTEIALTDYEKIQSVINELESLRKGCEYLHQCPISELEQHVDSSEFYVKIDPSLAALYGEMIKNGSFIPAFKEFLELTWLERE